MHMCAFLLQHYPPRDQQRCPRMLWGSPLWDVPHVEWRGGSLGSYYALNLVCIRCNTDTNQHAFHQMCFVFLWIGSHLYSDQTWNTCCPWVQGGQGGIEIATQPPPSWTAQYWGNKMSTQSLMPHGPKKGWIGMATQCVPPWIPQNRGIQMKWLHSLTASLREN